MFLSLVFPAAQQRALAADTLRIASYNVLNYPGSTSGVRNPRFRTVLRQIAPEILVVQEMLDSAGMTQFLSQVLNPVFPGSYAAAPFNDGPDTDNGLFYRTSSVAFLGVTYLPTALRDIAEYRVRILTTGDTLRLYSLHLKASTGSTNEQQRLAEATILRNHLNALPAGTKFLVVGDYNIYRSSEPAFQKLIGSEADNDGRCFDQLNLVGDWGTEAFAQWHTQSPRVRSFDGGSTGGMDDRFDIMLSSFAMQSRLITSSITAYGNDGQHWNDSINRLPNLAVPDSIANALHYASDHLPVFGDVVLGPTVLVPPVAVTRPATGVSALAGTLQARVVPNGSVTTVRFAYGIAPGLGDTTTQQNVGGGTDSVSVAAPLAGLQPGTPYAFRVIAANSGGISTGSLLTFTTLPLAPFAVTATPSDITTSSATLNGSVNPNGSSTQARFAFGSSPVLTDTTVLQEIGSGTLLLPIVAGITGLQPGTKYYYSMLGINAGGAAAGAVETLRTVLLPPIAPLLASPPDGASIPSNGVRFVWNAPPGAAGYRLQIDLDSTFAAPLLDDSTIVDTTIVVDSLVPGPLYFWRVEARNSGGASPFSAPRQLTTLPILTIGIPYVAEWNLVSVPVTVTDGAAAILFPAATSSAFRFSPSTGYAADDSLDNGTGYWLKFDAAGAATITGVGRQADTIAVETGWNLIGSISTPVDTGTIAFEPAGIRASEFFSYSGAYEPATALLPGAAYWVKVSAPGLLLMTSVRAIPDRLILRRRP